MVLPALHRFRPECEFAGTELGRVVAVTDPGAGVRDQVADGRENSGGVTMAPYDPRDTSGRRPRAVGLPLEGGDA